VTTPLFEFLLSLGDLMPEPVRGRLDRFWPMGERARREQLPDAAALAEAAVRVFAARYCEQAGLPSEAALLRVALESDAWRSVEAIAERIAGLRCPDHCERLTDPEAQRVARVVFAAAHALRLAPSNPDMAANLAAWVAAAGESWDEALDVVDSLLLAA
jgi:hypothetical protein